MEEKSTSSTMRKGPPQAARGAAAASLLAMAASLAGDAKSMRMAGRPAPDKPVKGRPQYKPGQEVTVGGVEYVAGPGGNLVRKYPKSKGKKKKLVKGVHRNETETKTDGAPHQGDDAEERPAAEAPGPPAPGDDAGAGGGGDEEGRGAPGGAAEAPGGDEGPAAPGDAGAPGGDGEDPAGQAEAPEAGQAGPTGEEGRP